MGILALREETATPATLGTNYVGVYAKIDGKVYKNVDGVESELGAGSGGGSAILIPPDYGSITTIATDTADYGGLT